jgi:hypothetical protein
MAVFSFAPLREILTLNSISEKLSPARITVGAL